MIDDEKLLCAFVYSAYDSGYCGVDLGLEREEYMKVFRDFVSGNGRFPSEELGRIFSTMKDVGSSNIRDYVYGTHLDSIAKDIEKETGKSFDVAVRDSGTGYIALRCPVHFYSVESFEDKGFTGKNLVLPKVQGNGLTPLKILTGLESPEIGDVVSGHWDHFLEVVDAREFKGYEPALRSYMERIKGSVSGKLVTV